MVLLYRINRYIYNMRNTNLKIVLLYLDLGRRQYAKVAERKSRTEYNPLVEFSTEYNPKVERPGFRPAQTKWQAPWGVEHEDAYSV